MYINLIVFANVEVFLLMQEKEFSLGTNFPEQHFGVDKSPVSDSKGIWP